jgi:hypothetical protein
MHPDCFDSQRLAKMRASNELHGFGGAELHFLRLQNKEQQAEIERLRALYNTATLEREVAIRREDEAGELLRDAQAKIKQLQEVERKLRTALLALKRPSEEQPK